MMADDLGYNDLSCYGSERQKTPVLDKLAKEGLRLTSFYAGATVCTPSRMALLTGAYPPRLGWNGGVVGYGLKPQNGLAPQARTMGDVFKEAGYKTALIGKWHLGDTPELHPAGPRVRPDLLHRQEQQPDQEALAGQGVGGRSLRQPQADGTFLKEAVAFVKSNSKNPSSLPAFQRASFSPRRPIPTGRENRSMPTMGMWSRNWMGGLAICSRYLKTKSWRRIPSWSLSRTTGPNPGRENGGAASLSEV